MSLNTSHTPDVNGILIYNGERILLYCKLVKLSFKKCDIPEFKSTKSACLYLTTHRVILLNKNKKDAFKSLAVPFHCLRNVTLEQPLLTPNYLKGQIQPLSGGNFDKCVDWKLSFPRGGCIDFGQTLLRAIDIATRSRPFNAPPAYSRVVPPSAPEEGTPETYYSVPPNCYYQGGSYQGFQTPTNVFYDVPLAGSVYVYDQVPPYNGIGPPTPYPAGSLNKCVTPAAHIA